jgi:hypothetical protein
MSVMPPVQDKTVGYTTSAECQKVQRTVCSVIKEKVLKQKPLTGCTKVHVHAMKLHIYVRVHMYCIEEN